MDSPEVPVQEGDILAGKYRVERVLGIGGMGVVVAALHLELEQRVALKFLLPAAATKPDVIARFSREARAAAKIRSEHVARVSDVGMLDNGLPYIVMEYLEGADLADRLGARGKLPIGLAVDYILQACEAIAEAHAAGIIHRDLKPGNLFLARQSDGSESIKVLDFGISKSVLVGTDSPTSDEARLTKTTDVFGSPMYMSPEQLKSARDVDARSDQWALGAILFELLTGKGPFEHNTIAEIFGAILYQKPPSLRSLVKDADEGLERTIERCLQKDPADRYPNVAELAQALLPFGSRASRSAAERATRVLRRAGAKIESIPPMADDAPPPSDPIPLRATRAGGLVDAAAVTNLAPLRHPSAASTRTSWGRPEGTTRPRSTTRRAALGLLVSASLVGVGVVVVKRDRLFSPASSPSALGVVQAPALLPEPSASVAPEAPLSASPPVFLEAPTASAPSANAPSASPLASSPVAVSTAFVQPVPPRSPGAPTLSAPPAPHVTAAPIVTPAPVVTAAPIVSAAPTVGPAVTPPAPSASAIATAPPKATVAPKASAPPPEDSDDFGGRL